MRNVVIGFLGTQLDAGVKRPWRPTRSLFQHDDFPIDRLEILYDERFARLLDKVSAECQALAPDAEIRPVRLDLANPWDFEEVYGKLFDFARDYGFDEDREHYFVHLTTGTHVAQICWFLLTESRHVPARLIQTGPPRGKEAPPQFGVIDLDLSRYDKLQQRFDVVTREHGDLLKGGIETEDPTYNAMIDAIERAAAGSDAPILLLGEGGTGKTALARRLFDLERQARRLKGKLIDVPCAMLRGPDARAALFGQTRSFAGHAGSERMGFSSAAHGGLLFLDEIDLLGLDEQALLAHALESGQFRPLGADSSSASRFRLIAASNRDLSALARRGAFREDLLALLDRWSFTLPPLRARRRDVEPNLRHERARMERLKGARFGFNVDASDAYLRFATDPSAAWRDNFRDFRGSIQRLCALAPRGRITRAMVDDEIHRLRARWAELEDDDDAALLRVVLGEAAAAIDPFDQAQLAAVLRACAAARSLSEAGRHLFRVSRAAKSTQNDADRLRKYLARFGLDWTAIQEAGIRDLQRAGSPIRVGRSG